MTKKAVANIPEKKLKAVEELTNLIKEKRTVLVADISNIPGSQFQQISKKLRGKAVVKVPKKNLLKRALEKANKGKSVELADNFSGANALLFSDLDSFELAGDLIKKRSPAKAKVGQIAPTNIEVPEGETDLVPGPAISELGALGIQIQIQAGKIHIKEPKVVAKEGEAISQGAADILSKLNILPFSIGFTPLSAYDDKDGVVYNEIKIDTELTIEELKDSFARSLGFAVNLGYTTQETTPLMVQKAASHEKRLISVITGEPEVVAQAEPAEDAPAEETKQEEKKEEVKTDFAASFF